MCGHATLATAFVLMNFVEPDVKEVEFSTLSGKLSIKNGVYEMDFPAYELKQLEVTETMEKAIGFKPLEARIGRDLICVLENEDQVIQAKPDVEKVKALEGLLRHITTKGKVKYDCVSRTFAPKLAVDEDPVCGSGHCHLVSLWSEKLRKNEILAYQASARGGLLYCELDDSRVKLAGKAAIFSVGSLNIESKQSDSKLNFDSKMARCDSENRLKRHDKRRRILKTGREGSFLNGFTGS